MLFLFAYGDIFGFFNPGHIEEVIAGEVSGIKVTQIFLLGVSLYITIASVTILLSSSRRGSAAGPTSCCRSSTSFPSRSPSSVKHRRISFS
jgi:hypothetical protein